MYSSLAKGYTMNSTQATLIMAHPPSASEILRFLDFPREIRDKIYVECLVVEKVYPYLKKEQEAWPDRCQDQITQGFGRRSVPSSASNAGLNMNLLLANKQVYHESSQILFSHNTFVMPTWAFMSKFFDIYAGKAQLNRIKKIELAFTQLDPLSAPQILAIDQRLSAQERDIIHIKFPLARTDFFTWMAPELERCAPRVEFLRIGRQDVLTAWLRKAMLAKSLESCTSITVRLHEAEYAFSRLDEYALWHFVMPATPKLRPVGWAPTLPAGMQVEGLGLGRSLEDVLRNIQGYLLQPMPLIRARPRS